MIKDPIAARISAPYSRAIFDYAVDSDQMSPIGNDLKVLLRILRGSPQFLPFLNSPVVPEKAKYDFLNDILKKKVQQDTLNFLTILIDRDRIIFLEEIVFGFFQLVFKIGNIRVAKIITPIDISNKQKKKIRKRLEDLTKARSVRIITAVNPDLVGGMQIQTKSKLLDFSIKTKLQNLAKYLDPELEV